MAIATPRSSLIIFFVLLVSAASFVVDADAQLTAVLDFVVVDEDVEKSKDWEWKWSCNECKADPTAPAGLVAKNKEFDKIMDIIPAIIKQAVAGTDNSTKPAAKS
ncbi:hypothetical protein TRIUR3_20253 [Triticum urartu]|uniref:Uncharacterized protein n=2 Tax=Triticum TaxID=4564 RepID=A0A9R1NTV3_TRITD|nr:hypothetical protein TRIUR3_20253 [Triticum urartu]VAH31049.1 unnamed protein product [Triticum turgidum subsp. durum]